MRLRKFLCALLAALFISQTLPLTAFADEGMWPINNVPKAEIKRKYGFDVTDEWLKKVQMAAVRFPNGSGSFVSPDGLVLTNYHIVEDFVGELSTAQKDYAKEGFVARTRAEELKIPSLELNVLVSIEDVTDRVNGAVKPDMTAADAFSARRAAISKLEADSLEKTNLRSDVVTLYQGGQYNLYRYKKYTDVRLVWVPEFQAAFFGGDPDNFNYPRFNIDAALVRAYENDKPVRVENYLKWSDKGVEGRRPGFRRRPSRLDPAPQHGRAPRTTARREHPAHHTHARTARGHAEEIHGDGRGADAPGAERIEQRAEQSESLPRPDRGASGQEPDRAEAPIGRGTAQGHRGRPASSERVRRRLGDDCDGAQGIWLLRARAQNSGSSLGL